MHNFNSAIDDIKLPSTTRVHFPKNGLGATVTLCLIALDYLDISARLLHSRISAAHLMIIHEPDIFHGFTANNKNDDNRHCQ